MSSQLFSCCEFDGPYSLLSDKTIALAVQNNVALSMDVYNGTYTVPLEESLDTPKYLFSAITIL